MFPIDRGKVEVHQRHTNGRTGKTLGSRDRESQLRSEQYGDSSAEFNREASSRTDAGDAVTQGADDMVSEEPESSAEEETGYDQDPHRGAYLAGDFARDEGVIGSDPRCHGVGDVIGAMSDGHYHGGGDLCVCPEVFDLVIVDGGVGVNRMELVCIEGDTLFADATEESVLDPGKSTGRVVDGLSLGGTQ